MVEPNVAIQITKACCVLHNYVRRRDGFNSEDTFSCPMEDVTARIGVENSATLAKDVREYFVSYVNDPIHSLNC